MSCSTLNVPREIVLERISARRVCRDCGTNYTATGNDPSPWICDVCGGDVLQREDDTPDSVNRRLDLYEEQTFPLVQALQRPESLWWSSTVSATPTRCLLGWSKPSKPIAC